MTIKFSTHEILDFIPHPLTMRLHTESCWPTFFQGYRCIVPFTLGRHTVVIILFLLSTSSRVHLVNSHRLLYTPSYCLHWGALQEDRAPGALLALTAMVCPHLMLHCSSASPDLPSHCDRMQFTWQREILAWISSWTRWATWFLAWSGFKHVRPHNLIKVIPLLGHWADDPFLAVHTRNEKVSPIPSEEKPGVSPTSSCLFQSGIKLIWINFFPKPI